MYPWACAVNTKSQILVTDSRNHRIQLFSPDGHFISRFSFDGVNHSRYLKGLTTPRGAAFNPQGNIIISDFENHRLILIDSSMTKVSYRLHHFTLCLLNNFIQKQRFWRPKDTKAQQFMSFADLQEYVAMMTVELLLLIRRIKGFSSFRRCSSSCGLWKFVHLHITF